MLIDPTPLYRMQQNLQARWLNPENPNGQKGAAATSNASRKGAPNYGHLPAGATTELLNIQGSSGMIRHIWTTIDKRTPTMLRGLRLEFFWDGASEPAISVPYGDFFGLGLGLIVPFQSCLFSSPEGRNFNSLVPMPFHKGCRITVTNETTADIDTFWWQADLTLGDEFDDDMLYFHAHWRREQETVLRQDYTFLPRIEGRGRYLGVNVGIVPNEKRYGQSWWGEGEVKIFLDGDTDLPTLAGTGTEDYIGTSWGQGKFDHLYQGCPVHNRNANGIDICYYRYHVADPIFFHTDIRITIQCIGCGSSPDFRVMHEAGTPLVQNNQEATPYDTQKLAEAGEYRFFEREKDDISSCTYFYLERPENGLPKLAEVEERIAGLAMNKSIPRADVA